MPTCPRQHIPQIQEAQRALDTHPDNSPYWDSAAGQETLAIAREFGLKSDVSNRERAAIHGRSMREAIGGHEDSPCLEDGRDNCNDFGTGEGQYHGRV